MGVEKMAMDLNNACVAFRRINGAKDSSFQAVSVQVYFTDSGTSACGSRTVFDFIFDYLENVK